MTRTVLTLAALALTPALIACDSKPEPGDTSNGSNVAATEGATEGDAETTDHGEVETTEQAETTDHGEVVSTTDAAPEDAECTWELYGHSRTCEGGIQYCASDDAYPEPKLFWGPCLDEPVCTPEPSDDCVVCELDSEGRPQWVDNCEEGGTTTPLVLSFGSEPVRYDSSAASFDLGPACGATDWPTAATPWLAFDRDGSGAIEAGRELFGSATVLRRGSLADNGFTALAELDHDRDGRISASDPGFARLLLWADHNADRRSTPWELTPVADAGVIAIGLTYRKDARCDARSNCEIERAAFSFRDSRGHERVGEVIDVHLSCQ
ncbi:calcium-binding protein [Nannocystis pusilla]|uniref:Calcium-binding protein n=1 Tax=Nannocystis pusilla TaxID=889268 RepID=A0ABS7TKQ8_9BACT|nr:calcium-binding protein [Nannocystis pusilla]MBZ5708794.1 calcium-binding protein [Nannocystis pusilla]